MVEARAERRLAAIVAIDVAGYSRLMGVDEEGTLATLKAHRRELWTPKIEEHGGHVVGTAGDSILVEFASAVAAVLGPVIAGLVLGNYQLRRLQAAAVRAKTRVPCIRHAAEARPRSYHQTIRLSALPSH